MTKTTPGTPELTDKPEQTFSVIAFFGLFEKELQKINTFPLTKDSLVIQQDAYKRLASLPTDDDGNEVVTEDYYESFAALECSKKERDTDLRFAIEFSAQGFYMHIEALDSFFVAYQDAFKTEEQAAREIAIFLTLLASGQMACLVTDRRGYACAVETLLHDKGSRIPLVTSTVGQYPKRWRKQDETDYDTTVLKNNYLDEITVPKNAFFVDRKANGEAVVKGRTFTSPELTPLTKKMYNQTMLDIVSLGMGQKPGQSDDFIFGRWELWAIIAILAIPFYGGAALGFLPHFILEYPFIGFAILPTLAGALIVPVLSYKEKVRETNPNHIWVRERQTAKSKDATSKDRKKRTS